MILYDMPSLDQITNLKICTKCNRSKVASDFGIASHHSYRPVQGPDEPPQAPSGRASASPSPDDAAQPGDKGGEELVAFGWKLIEAFKFSRSLDLPAFLVPVVPGVGAPDGVHADPFAGVVQRVLAVPVIPVPEHFFSWLGPPAVGAGDVHRRFQSSRW